VDIHYTIIPVLLQIEGSKNVEGILCKYILEGVHLIGFTLQSFCHSAQYKHLKEIVG
jgi:hypothetical protein